MLQIAAGIIIAAGVLGVIGLGLAIVLDRDTQLLQSTGPGWVLVTLGGLAALAIIYVAAQTPLN